MRNSRFRSLYIPLLSALVLALAACGGGGDDDDDAADDPVGQVRVINAVPDSPTLQIAIDDAFFANVSFAQSSTLTDIATGSYSVDVTYVGAGGTTETLIDDLALSVSLNEDVTVILTGPLEAVSTVVAEANQQTLTSPELEVHVAHAATGHGRLDVYVTTPDAALIGSTPLATLDYGGVSDLSTLDAGDYRLRVTAEGDDSVLYDSGTFELSALTRRLLLAVDYFGPGDADMRVVQVSPNSASTFVAEDLPTALRQVNLVYDLPAIDGYVGDAATPTFSAVPFGTASDYLEVASGNQPLTLTMEGDASAVLLSSTAQLIPGEFRTLVAAGSQTFDDVRGRLLSDGRRRIATTAQLRVVHGSPSVGDVDFYLLSPEQPVSDADPEFGSLTLLTNGLLNVEPGQYDLTFTPADEESILVGPERVTLNERGIYTVILSDGSGGGTPAQLVLADDFTGS